MISIGLIGLRFFVAYAGTSLLYVFLDGRLKLRLLTRYLDSFRVYVSGMKPRGSECPADGIYQRVYPDIVLNSACTYLAHNCRRINAYLAADPRVTFDAHIWRRQRPRCVMSMSTAFT